MPQSVFDQVDQALGKKPPPTNVFSEVDAALASRPKQPTNVFDQVDAALKPVSNWHGPAVGPTPATAVPTTPSRKQLGAPPKDEGWGGAINRFGRGLFHPEPKTPEDWEAQRERERRVFAGTPEKPTLFTPGTPERPTEPLGYVKQAYEQGGALGAAGEVAKMGVMGPLYGAFKQRDTPVMQLGEAFEPGTEARGVGEAVSHFGTPTNAAIIAGATMLTGIPAAALSAYFATDMGIGAYQTAEEIAKAKAEGREGDARELTGQFMVMLPAALGAAGHAGKKTVGIVGDRAGRIAPSEGPAVPPPPPTVDIPTGAAVPRARGPEVAGLKPAPTGSAPMEFAQARQRLADVDLTLAEAGKRRLTQVQQEQLAIEKADLERYLSREQMGLPFTEPNELRPAIPPSPVPEWSVPPGGRRPAAPYRSVLESERAVAEGVGSSAPSGQSTLWGEHFPAVERVKEVTQALEGGSTAARKFLESLKPEERDAFLNAAKQIADAETRVAETGTLEVTERPQMLGADPGQAGQLTMPFGDLAASEVGRPVPGRIPVGPDLSTRIAEAARLADRLKEFEPHQQSVMWGSELTDFAPEAPAYGTLPAVPPPLGGTPTARYPVKGRPAPPGFDQPTTGVHRMDLETARRTYPALKAQAEAIGKRDARLQRLQGRIYEERQKAGAAGYNPQKVAQLERDYRKIQSEGPSLAESPAILESVRQMEQQIGAGNLTGPAGPAIPPPPAGGRGGQAGPPTGGPPSVPPSPLPEGSSFLPKGSAERTYVMSRKLGEDMNYAMKHLEGKIPGGKHELGSAGKLSVDESAWAAMDSYGGLRDKVHDTLFGHDGLRKKLKPIQNTFAEDIRQLWTGERKPLSDVAREYIQNDHLIDLLNDDPAYIAPRGRTLEQIVLEQREIKERLTPDEFNRVKQAQQGIIDHNNKLLDGLVESGKVSAEAAADYRRRFPHYRPMGRVIEALEKDTENPYAAPGRSFSKQSSSDVIRQLKGGSALESVELGEGMANYTFRAIAAAEQGRVMQKLYALKDKLPGHIIPARPGNPSPPRMERLHAPVNGEYIPFDVPKDIADVVRGYTKQDADLLSRWIGKSTDRLRMGAVIYELTYPLAAVPRDIKNAVMRSPVGFQPWTLVNGMAHSFADALGHRTAGMSGYYQSMAGMAGFTGQLKPKFQSEALFESEAKRIGKLIFNPTDLRSNLVVHLMQALEMGPRAGVKLRASKTPGVSEREAGFWASDVTVKFSRGGSVAKVANLWAPFLTARIGGNANMARAARDSPFEFMALWTAMYGVPAVATYLYNTRNFPDVYKDIMPYVEGSHHTMILSDRKDAEGGYPDVLKNAKDEYAKMDGPLLEILKQMDTENPETLNRLAWEMGLAPEKDALKPHQVVPPDGMGSAIAESATSLLPIDPTPQGRFDPVAAIALSGVPIIRSALENSINRKFWNLQDIEPRAMRDREPWRRFDKATDPERVQWLGEIQKDLPPSVQIGPRKIQNVVESELAGVGQQIIRGESPLERGKRRVMGVPGGAVEYRKRQGFKPADTQYAMETADLVEPARKFINEVEKFPKGSEEHKRYIRENFPALPREIQDEVVAIAKRQRGELTDAEETLRAKPIGPRAMNLLMLLETTTDESQEQMIARWVKNGLLTEDTHMMMRQIQAAKARGVEPKLSRPAR